MITTTATSTTPTPIYLDNAASTPILPQVKSKLLETLDIFGNPSSLHSEGQKAKSIINESKEIIAARLNCDTDELFFTSGATMSNNLILQGYKGKVITTPIEHEDIIMMAKEFGWSMLDVDQSGLIINNQCDSNASLFSIQMANSEIGTIQDIKHLSETIHSYSEYNFLHTDATQYIPYYPVDVKRFGIDALSMSGQKIGCIKGIGILYISKRLQRFIRPVIYGKQGLIGGTENVLGIACLGEAFKCLDYKDDIKEMIRLRDKLIQQLDGELIGSVDKRLPNNACMCFEGVPAESIVMMLSEFGICCSAGSACSSNDNEPSATLLAIGFNKEKANSCVRFTLNKNTTEEEIDHVIEMTNNTVSMFRELY